MTRAVIEAKNVTKRFGGLTAVDNVDLVVLEQSISSIIGPNGAGKTTLFNCVSGFYVPEEGEMLFFGQPINGLPTHKVCQLGISRTYQNIRLFGEMTALENILVGEHVRLKRIGWRRLFMARVIDTKKKNRWHGLMSSWNMWAFQAWKIHLPVTCHTAPSVAWRSPGHWPASRRSSCWMSRPQV